MRVPEFKSSNLLKLDAIMLMMNKNLSVDLLRSLTFHIYQSYRIHSSSNQERISIRLILIKRMTFKSCQIAILENKARRKRRKPPRIILVKLIGASKMKKINF